MNPKFEKLRDMESFGNEMFTRIVAVQQKEHACWNPEAPFAERIKGLPLYNLIFSNPDRNAAATGPTISHFYPLRREMRKIAHYARQVAAAPVVCDIDCRNGFVGSLLAREGVKVIGVRDPAGKPNQIADFYDPKHYELRTLSITGIDFPFDVAFCAWMPSGVNYTPELLNHSPKLIVYVYTDHIDAPSGRRQTGTADAFDNLPPRYKLIDEWQVVRPQDMMHEVWPDLGGFIEETRLVKIYADEPWHDISLRGYTEAAKGYDWETDLDMALLALEAKQFLRAQGMPV